MPIIVQGKGYGTYMELYQDLASLEEEIWRLR